MSNFFGFVQRQATRTETWVSLCSVALGTGVMSWVTAQWHTVADQGWAAIFIVALLCSGVVLGVPALVFLSISKLRSKWNSSIRGEKSAPFTYAWDNALPHIQVFGKKFINERVVLDGSIFRDCRFENITFVFNGTQGFEFTHNHIIGRINLATGNPGVESTILWLKGVGALAGTFKLDLPPGVKVETILFTDSDPPP